MKCLLSTIVFFAVLSGASAAEPAAPTPANMQAPPESVARWQAMRFGMFIHWGPVSLKGTEIGWSRLGPRRGRTRQSNPGSIPANEYDNLYRQFNPVKFDADEWVATAKAAGMKYMVFTSKHHDGFSMFDSRLTDYDIMESPYGRDICRQLADACHGGDLKLGWYYSPRDWYHPAFATERHREYLDFYLGQLRELTTNYGKVDILWFDGLDSPVELWGDTPQRSFELLRTLQPGIVINNRGGLPGDFDTPEQRIGSYNRERPWETCMTICHQWAWKPDDRMKSLEECLQTLLRVVGGDGNLLFNVGPMPDGRIEPRQVARLKQMGDWLGRYGETVYGTRGGPFQPGSWGASTVRGNRIYLFVMNWPQGRPLELPPLPTRVVAAKGLSCRQVAFTQQPDGITVDVPAAQRDAIATVVELAVDGDAFAIPPVPVSRLGKPLAVAKATASRSISDKYQPAMAIDGDTATRWATPAGTAEASLELDLGRPQAVDTAWVSEAFAGRVESYRLECHDGQQWKPLATGNRLGSDCEIGFEPVTAQLFRLNILRASEGPTLWEFQLFAPK